MGKVEAGKSVWRWESRSREIGERDEGGKKNKKKMVNYTRLSTSYFGGMTLQSP